MATMITVHARPTRKDIILARLSVYFGSVYGRVISIASLTLPALYLLLVQARPDTNLVVVTLAGILVLPGAFAFAGINSRTVKNIVTQGQKYVFNETGFETSNSLGQAQLRWEAIKRTHESPERFVLLGTGALIVIPKRSFRDSPEVDSFRDLLKRRASTSVA